MARFEYDGKQFQIGVEKVFRHEGGKLTVAGYMATVRLVDQRTSDTPLPVVDDKGVVYFKTADDAEQGAAEFIVKQWNKHKPKPRLAKGRSVYVSSRNSVGVVAEDNLTFTSYFRITFPDGQTADIHETDLTPVSF